VECFSLCGRGLSRLWLQNLSKPASQDNRAGNRKEGGQEMPGEEANAQPPFKWKEVVDGYQTVSNNNLFRGGVGE